MVLQLSLLSFYYKTHQILLENAATFLLQNVEATLL